MSKKMMVGKLLLAFLLLIMGVVGCEDDDAGSDWYTVWGRAVHHNDHQVAAGIAFYPTVEDQTLRMIVRPTHSGSKVRLHFSNYNSPDPITLDEVWIGQRQSGPVLTPGTNTQITFAGNASVSIDPGAVILSDPIEFEVVAFEELAVSIYVSQAATIRDHDGEIYVTNFITAGNAAADEAASGSFTDEIAYTGWLFALDVFTDECTGTIVAFGDSITDGTSSTVGTYATYPDMLAVRLQAAAQDTGASGYKSVVNMGIGGNTVSSVDEMIGASGELRIGRDALNLTNVTHVMVLLGTNDLHNIYVENGIVTHPAFGTGIGTPEDADDVIPALENIINAAHDQGVAAIGMTLLPRTWVPLLLWDGLYEFDAVEREAQRQTINDWILEDADYDAVIDASAFMVDPGTGTTMLPAYDCGDGLHPNDVGYAHMAESIDLSVFED